MKVFKVRSEIFSVACILAGVAIAVFGIPLSANTRIVLDADASDIEKTAALELKSDIERVCSNELVTVDRFPLENEAGFSGNTIFLGTSLSNGFLGTPETISKFSLLNETLEPETFVLQTARGNAGASQTDLVIMGADERGLLYGVYEFSKLLLGVDPMEYWTGKKPVAKKSLIIPDLSFRERPPRFKLRGYFDNDNDMLANWKGRKLIVEFDIWKEMIDSLARLRYNYIDIHDLLGRPEYYLRDYYLEMTEYHTDLELVDRVIDYAHSKGMLVQIPMYLGWELKHLEMDEVCLTSNFNKWMDIYSYYLRETPLGKGDLFLARPRHPIYDWPYSCPEEEELQIPVGPLLEVVFSGLGKLINKYRPGGILVCDLWQEGRALWTEGQFSPHHEVQMLWADNGFAEIEEWPARHKGYAFGVYLHAGVWKNQVVQDPYPHRIKEALSEAVSRGMVENVLVNGQNFKPFILNLEACARAAWDPDGFEADVYYKDWTSRYFGQAASSLVVKSLEMLHKVHEYSVGFRDVTKASENILKKLDQSKAETENITNVRTSLALARKSLELALEAQPLVPDGAEKVFDDQIVFPCTLLVENLELLKSLIEFNNVYLANRGGRTTKAKERVRNAGRFAREKLLNLRTSLELGSSWEKWKNWTHPDNFRIHTPPPKLEDLDALLESL